MVTEESQENTPDLSEDTDNEAETTAIRGRIRDLNIEELQKLVGYGAVCIFVLDVSRADAEQWTNILFGLNAFGNDIDENFNASNTLMYVLASSLDYVANELQVPKSFISKPSRKLNEGIKVASMLEEDRLAAEETLQTVFETTNTDTVSLVAIKEASAEVYRQWTNDVCGVALETLSARSDMTTIGERTIQEAVQAEETVILKRDIVESYAKQLNLTEDDFRESELSGRLPVALRTELAKLVSTRAHAAIMGLPLTFKMYAESTNPFRQDMQYKAERNRTLGQSFGGDGFIDESLPWDARLLPKPAQRFKMSSTMALAASPTMGQFGGSTAFSTPVMRSGGTKKVRLEPVIEGPSSHESDDDSNQSQVGSPKRRERKQTRSLLFNSDSEEEEQDDYRKINVIESSYVEGATEHKIDAKAIPIWRFAETEAQRFINLENYINDIRVFNELGYNIRDSKLIFLSLNSSNRSFMLSEITPDALKDLNKFVQHITEAYGQNILDLRQQLNNIKQGMSESPFSFLQRVITLVYRVRGQGRGRWKRLWRGMHLSRIRSWVSSRTL